MKAALRCAAVIRRLGGTAQLLRNGTTIPFPAVVQVRRGGVGAEMDPMGLASPRYYTLFAPLDTEAGRPAEGEAVLWRGQPYLILRAETFCLSGEPVYYWAVLRRAEGEGTP